MANQSTQSPGFDSPVVRAEEDHLNRWPLASQIYNVASNGPADWSVRIGIYGEWGTGKTSVLKFVSAMAEADGHIVVWFDPWGYSSKPDLWHSFVITCCNRIEEKVGGVTAAGDARRRSYFEKARSFLSKAATAVPGDAGTIATGALGVLKDAFSFGAEDLQKLRSDLGTKRVFVLVDDLDRTASELVPEILYALKEVFDIPGFSFVCGFDPVVVGKVLRASHRGFGDGLKFLEKIIDYPIWLPPATAPGLMKIALADASKYCPYVPTDDVRQVIPLLPQNPRAIRQFIRLLSLLKDQVARYDVYELRWPAILAATVIKVRHPKLADALLNDQGFWQVITMTEMMAVNSTGKEKVSEEITKHIAKCEKIQSIDLSNIERDQISQGLTGIVGKLSLWSGDGVELIQSQISITESPQAVTWKEFDACRELCEKGALADQVKAWIVKHTMDQHCSESRVANELTRAALARYRDELHKADDAFNARQKGKHKQNAMFLMRLLEELVLRIADTIPALGSREWLPLTAIFGDLISLANAIRPVHTELWPRTERLLIGLAENWRGNLELLHRGVRSVDPSRSANIENVEDRRVALLLKKILDNRIAELAAAGFGEARFVERMTMRSEETYEFQDMMIRPESGLWTTFKSKVLATLRQAKKNAIVQENAHAFLVWIEYLLRTGKSIGLAGAEKIMGHHEIMPALWNAATVVPFSGRFAYRLRHLPNKTKECGVDLVIPAWWQPSIDETLKLYEREAALKKAMEND
ncbi:MAG: P-loop NTPase fold protein [Verrucomicrobia bacterium]|nr:P-loop NTPase fold protein [Verrucomicrobiota bacterium]